MACHLVVSLFSYLIPPRQAVDWLMAGSAELTLTALLASWKRWPGPVVMIFSAVTLLAAGWLALRQLPFLLVRNEPPVQRELSIVAGLAGLLAVFCTAELSARKVTAAALLGGLSVFALLLAVSLWRMVSPPNEIARTLAAAAVCAGAAVAALVRYRHAVIAPGMAGWLGGGIVVYFAFGCLTRAADVPLQPLGAAAGALPAAAILAMVFRRVFAAGQSVAFLAAMVLAGTGVFALSPPKEEKAPAKPVETGADDTGAYD
jgi:hypothetical protein